MSAIIEPRALHADDRSFFASMAAAITAIVIVGFGSHALAGRVDIPSVPLWVHPHGAVFMGWTLLYFTQSLLALRGPLALHRRLGWIGALLVVLMLPLGMATAVMAVRLNRVPPFFTPGLFLALSAMELLCFAGFVVAGLRLRRRSDWHRRLMLCAMVAVMEPAFGRLLPMPLLGPFGGLAILGCQLLLLSIAAMRDWRADGRPHPVWGIGAATLVAKTVAIPLLGFSAPVVALAAALAAP